MENKFKRMTDLLLDDAENCLFDLGFDTLDKDIEYISNFWDNTKQRETVELFYSITLSDTPDVFRNYSDESNQIEYSLETYASEWVNLNSDEYPTPIFKQETKVNFLGANNRVCISHSIYFYGEC